MQELRGIALVHDADMSTYSCSIPMANDSIEITIEYIESDTTLGEMIGTAEEVVDSWSEILARVVDPIRTVLRELEYEWAEECDIGDFMSPTLSINDDPDSPLFAILLDLPQLNGDYYLKCTFDSCSSTPTKRNVTLVSHH